MCAKCGVWHPAAVLCHHAKAMNKAWAEGNADAAAVDALLAENAALRHDIERHIAIAAELATENTALKLRVDSMDKAMDKPVDKMDTSVDSAVDIVDKPVHNIDTVLRAMDKRREYKARKEREYREKRKNEKEAKA